MNRICILVAVFILSLSRAPAQDKRPLPPSEAKAAFLKLLDRPRVAPDVKNDAEPVTKDGLTQYRWSFASEKKATASFERVPALTIVPSGMKGKLPVIIVLHGTGGSKEGMIGWLNEFAKHGLEAIAIDARYHGGRSLSVKGSASYVAAITKAWQTKPGQHHEHPFYYDTVWDLWRLVDLLEVSKGRRSIGMMGVSMGGIETWLAASVDDRIRVAAPLIAVQSFRWSLVNDRWQGRANTIKAAHEAAARDLGEAKVNRKVCRQLWGKVVPGIVDDFDCPNLLPLFADRALFISGGDRDANCPIEGARLAIRAAEAAFAKSGDKRKLEVHIGEKIGHAVTEEHRKAAVGFCVKWLKTAE